RTAHTSLHTLSLPDALPIFPSPSRKFVLPPSSGKAPVLLWQPAQPLLRRVATANRSAVADAVIAAGGPPCGAYSRYAPARPTMEDRKSTRLNSSHVAISYAV